MVEVESRTSSRPSAAHRAVGLVVVLAMAVAGCGDDDDDNASGESTTAAPAPELEGRLMFSRFEEATHTFVSTHVTNADGSEERELVLPGPEGGGRWSRDGAHIAVMTLVGERVGTAIISPDGTVERVLELPDTSLNLVCTVWSQDDSRLGCEGWDDTDPSRRGIYTVSSTDGSDVQRLTTAVEGTTDLPGDFSPDGSQLVFSRGAGEEGAGQLMLVDVAGGDARTLSSARRFEGSGRFSPDGSSILTSAGGAILVLGLDGEVVSEIVEDGAFLFGPVWSPGGDLIAFSRTTSGSHADVFISRPDGDERVQTTDTPDNEIVVEWGAEP